MLKFTNFSENDPVTKDTIQKSFFSSVAGCSNDPSSILPDLYKVGRASSALLAGVGPPSGGFYGPRPGSSCQLRSLAPICLGCCSLSQTTIRNMMYNHAGPEKADEPPGWQAPPPPPPPLWLKKKKKKKKSSNQAYAPARVFLFNRRVRYFICACVS